MAIRRGTIYRTSAFSRASGLLVLTNDEWNDAPTQDLSGALVFTEAGPGRTAIPKADVWAGLLLAVPKDILIEPVADLAPQQLRPVEDALCDALALRDLCATPPTVPPGLSGVIDYPRWSQIYYAGPPVGVPPQRKRHLVVSHDAYNRALSGAICVRTTTSNRRGGRGIPALRDGSKAVCVLATFISSGRVRMGRGDVRPVPAQLFLPGMASVAHGLIDAFELSSVLDLSQK